jgi:hypothetical protein
MSRRVLITGSRTWTDTLTIRYALGEVWGDGTAVLISGACPTGADSLAEQIWRQWGGHVQRHPADWARYGRSAGSRRNAEMVTAGAEVCLAFIRDGSAGATHTARLAEATGIPTRRYPHSPRDVDQRMRASSEGQLRAVEDAQGQWTDQGQGQGQGCVRPVVGSPGTRLLR